MDGCVNSVKHHCMYLEALISTTPNDMTDAISFSTKIQNQFIEAPEFLFWRGRILLYNGQQDMGKKHIKQALQVDPDFKQCQQFWKNIQKAEKAKTEAAECFQRGEIEQALKLYDDCLAFDPLNNSFNMAIVYNKACGLSKVGQTDAALDALSQAIKMNPEYVKAYFKRGDILLETEKFEEAIREYSKVKEFAPQTPGLREKLKAAQLELKKSKRKDLYKILEVDKGAGPSMIKTAYRKRAVQWHPDKHANSDEATQKEAEAKFKEIGEAYAILSDPKKKEMYDSGMDVEEIEQGGGGHGGMGGMNPNDIFAQMFAQGGMGGMGGMGGGQRFTFNM